MMEQIQQDLARTQRKLDLLCNWITLKFGSDPMLPKSLCQPFSNQLKDEDDDVHYMSPAVTVSSAHGNGGNAGRHFLEGGSVNDEEIDPDPDALVPIVSYDDNTPAYQFENVVTSSSNSPANTKREGDYSEIGQQGQRSGAEGDWLDVRAYNSRVRKRPRRIDDDLDSDYNPKAPQYRRILQKIKRKKIIKRGNLSKTKVDGRHPCPKCQKSFAQRQQMRFHALKNHPVEYEAMLGTKRIQCPDCHRFFDGELGLACHQKRVHHISKGSRTTEASTNTPTGPAPVAATAFVRNGPPTGNFGPGAVNPSPKSAYLGRLGLARSDRPQDTFPNPNTFTNINHPGSSSIPNFPLGATFTNNSF